MGAGGGQPRVLPDTPHLVPRLAPPLQAPEVINGERSTEASDVFSFGIVLWEASLRSDGAVRVSERAAGAQAHRARAPRRARPPSLASCGEQPLRPPAARPVPQLMSWEIPWSKVSPWSVVAQLLNGGRPALPAYEELPGGAADNAAFRPALPAYEALVRACWAQAPGERPDFAEVIKRIRWVGGRCCCGSKRLLDRAELAG